MQIPLLKIGVVAAAFLFSGSLAAETYKRVSSSKFHWTIAVPSSWKVNKRDPSSVIMSSSDGRALCGVHSGYLKKKKSEMNYDELRRMVKQMMAAPSHLKLKVVRQRNITLPSGAIGIEVMVDLVPGGRSLRRYSTSKGAVFAVDCETYASEWKSKELTFKTILKTFDHSR